MTEETQAATTVLEKAKNVHKSYGLFEKGYKAVTSILSGGATGNVIRIIAVLALGFAFVFIKKYIDKLKREYAEKLTISERAVLEEYVRSLDLNNSDSDFEDENEL